MNWYMTESRSCVPGGSASVSVLPSRVSVSCPACQSKSARTRRGSASLRLPSKSWGCSPEAVRRPLLTTRNGSCARTAPAARQPRGLAGDAVAAVLRLEGFVHDGDVHAVAKHVVARRIRFAGPASRPRRHARRSAPLRPAARFMRGPQRVSSGDAVTPAHGASTVTAPSAAEAEPPLAEPAHRLRIDAVLLREHAGGEPLLGVVRPAPAPRPGR